MPSPNRPSLLPLRLMASTALLAVLSVCHPASARSDMIADVLAGGHKPEAGIALQLAAAELNGAEGNEDAHAETGEPHPDAEAETAENEPDEEEIERLKVLESHIQALSPAGGITAPRGGAPKTGHMAALEPYQLIRSLQFVQDAVVGGDHSAMEMQRFLLGVIDDRLRKADQAVFDNPRNVDAALVYAMSGGNPSTLDLLALRDRFGNFDNEITTVLRAYLDGRAARTKTTLEELLVVYRDSDISPYLALVAANVKAGINEEGSLAMFDWARLGAPGTIIEEAALRRSLAIATKKANLDKAIHYATLYARRFIRSPYAGQFADLLVELAVEHYHEVGAERLMSVLAFMDRPRQREVYLRIARKAAIYGERELAILAADNAKALSGTNDLAPAALAGLYSGLANVSSEEVKQIDEDLAELENAALSPRDAALRNAARLIANEIVREPDPNSLTQAFSPNMDEQKGDEGAPAANPQAGNLPKAITAAPDIMPAKRESGDEPRLAKAEAGVDPEFRAYLENKSRLIEEIDQLLEGQDGVE